MNRIKECREKYELSQKELAEYLGCPRSTVSAWEQFVNEPNQSTWIALARFFHVSVDYLMGGDGESTAGTVSGALVSSSEESPLEAEIHEVVGSLSKELQNQVLGYAKGLAVQYAGFQDGKKKQ